MAEYFKLGETKVRPGAYFTVQKRPSNDVAEAINGVTAVIFRADFGPLNTAVEIDRDEGYEDMFGNGGTTDAVKEPFSGGAQTVIACRAGNGGTPSTVTLNDSDGEAALTITAAYPGKKDFTVTIREKLTDSTLKECIIYSGTAEFAKTSFKSGDGEAAALVAALSVSKKFKAELKSGKDMAVLADVAQSAFTAGTDPQVTAADYSNAFAAVEPYDFNTNCVDTEETAVHLLLQAFIERVFNAGTLAIGVVAEKHTVDVESRIAHAAAFNDKKMCYVINAHVNEQGTEIDGYQTAARIAGMIGATASNVSLTHTVINGFTEILEKLTKSQIDKAEKNGCIVLSANTSKQIWIDNAINTLVNPGDDEDDGWKKIRRIKTRFELIRRMNVTADNLAGKVDNDMNGRETVISQMQTVGSAMISEGKIVSCVIAESTAIAADGDSAWFVVDCIDKDSMEHIYLTYRFQFSTIEE